MSVERWGITEYGLIDRISEIEQALKSNLYQAALALALTIPDICGAYQYPETSVRLRYEKWFDEYVTPYYMPKILGKALDSNRRIMTGKICYCLRCAFFHSGNDDINANAKKNFLSDIDTGYKVSYNLILTTEYDSMECITHRGALEREYTIHISIPGLCQMICDAAKEYISDIPNHVLSTTTLSIYDDNQWNEDVRTIFDNCE